MLESTLEKRRKKMSATRNRRKTQSTTLIELYSSFTPFASLSWEKCLPVYPILLISGGLLNVSTHIQHKKKKVSEKDNPLAKTITKTWCDELCVCFFVTCVLSFDMHVSRMRVRVQVSFCVPCNVCKSLNFTSCDLCVLLKRVWIFDLCARILFCLLTGNAESLAPKKICTCCRKLMSKRRKIKIKILNDWRNICVTHRILTTTIIGWWPPSCMGKMRGSNFSPHLVV